MLSANFVIATLIAGSAALASPAIAIQEAPSSAVMEAPATVENSDPVESASTPAVEVTPTPIEAPVLKGWSALSDNGRYLSIMGTLDAFSASGVVAMPCFPSGDMGSIDKFISEKGFASSDPMQLPGILRQISDCSSKDSAGGNVSVGSAYTIDLFKDMRDEDIAFYVASAVNAYQAQGLCTGKQSKTIEKRLAKGLRDGESGAKAPAVMKRVLDDACKA